MEQVHLLRCSLQKVLEESEDLHEDTGMELEEVMRVRVRRVRVRRVRVRRVRVTLGSP